MMEQDEAILAALAQLTTKDAFSRYGAHGIGLAAKTVGGNTTGRNALTFFVACKLPASALPPERRIPPEIRFVRRSIGMEVTVETDVVESPPPHPLALPPGAAHRPIPGGVRCYLQSSGEAGTFGGWVWDKTDETIVFLSNQHVLGDTPGDPVNQPNSDVFAPAGETYHIGHVKRAAGLTPAQRPYTPDQCNFVDAAIGAVDDSDDIRLTVLEIGPAVYEIDNAVLGMGVEKSGQITLHTTGSVTAVAVNTLYDFPGIGDVVMCDLFRVEPDDPATAFSAQGDSGSLIFRRDAAENVNPCVGLLFGGGGSAQDGNQWAHGCRIQRVFDALDLDVLCSGGLAAFLDALLSDAEDEVAEGYAYSLLSPGRRPRLSNLARGMARDVQARLRTTKGGSEIADFVQGFRSSLLQLLVTKGDVRRAAAHALRPILGRSITVDRLLARKLDEEDVRRLALLFETVERHGPEDLAGHLAPFRRKLERAEGHAIRELI